jgi:hypothetical protein
MAKKAAAANKKVAVGIGVGVTAALLSAAGAYFLYGSKNADKNRKKVKSWMLKAKAEVLEGIEAAENMSKEDYERLVDKSVKTYSKLKDASADELLAFGKEMKAHWKNLEKKGMAKAKAAAPAKKAVKKAAKKAAKKSA